ncbi:MAG TPA: ATP-binding cassette domain-containing protein [Pyrinomonadaceae bacterium]|nr:ATP-binding cassette domain-containing protein [Pyrinomonadaceae bacterium]
MDETRPALILEHISKSFGDFTAVRDLSLQVKRGRIFGLIGPNGAGKTTTIRMIVNITVPDSGRVELFGQPMSTALQDRIGYLPEERGLYRKMKVGEQLRFFAELKDVNGKEADARIDKWLRKLQLADWKEKKAKDLSKGMQQKVQFITAVIHEPDLLILDEPFSGLDPVNVEVMKETILELKSVHKTIILSTHQMEIAEKLCDDVCMINRSRKVLDGKLRDIRRAESRNAVALRFEGHDGLLQDPELVLNVRQVGDDFEVLLADGVSPQTLLKRLIDANTVVTRFELVEPTLHDIFIAKVKETA